VGKTKAVNRVKRDIFYGYILDKYGGYQIAFIVIAVLSALAIIATLFIRQPKGYSGRGRQAH